VKNGFYDNKKGEHKVSLAKPKCRGKDSQEEINSLGLSIFK
jgi:hypothetical protein